MKKIVILSLVCLISAFGEMIAQQKNYANFCTRYNNDKEKIVSNLSKIKADDAWVLMLGVSLDPKTLEGLEYFEAVIFRDGADKAVFKMSVADFLQYGSPDEKTPGNKLGYPKVVTYKEDPENGKGNFYSNTYNTNFAADFYFSKKGMDYSNAKSVNEYPLTGMIYGYKFLNNVREKDLNDEWVTVPKYSTVTLAKITPVVVVTTDKVNPMPKTESVGDTNELIKLGE